MLQRPHVFDRTSAGGKQARSRLKSKRLAERRRLSQCSISRSQLRQEKEATQELHLGVPAESRGGPMMA